MEISFLGVGEACDSLHGNTSILLHNSRRSRQALLDCGFTVPHSYFAQGMDPDSLDFLWISHFHGDHFFGIPLLLLRFWEGGRKKPLTIFGPMGVEEIVRHTMHLAYPGFEGRFSFPLHFISLEPGAAELEWNGFHLQTAENEHSQRNLAIRLRYGKKSLFYSGDGRPTEETLELATGCSIIIHEAFHLKGDTPGHGSIPTCIDFAVKAKVDRLALVHICREDRAERMDDIQALISEVSSPLCFVPEAGQHIVI